jgi:ribosome-binding protein aMBF1 (putative translation factor)
MSRAFNLTRHLELAGQSNRGKRAFAARLDMALKRAGLPSGHVAKALRVAENVVNFWRGGVILPDIRDCQRLSALLNLDVFWLCAGGIVEQ